MILLHNVGELEHFFLKITLSIPEPYMTFEVKLLIAFVATHPIVILTKFGENPIKHVEEETNCEKEEGRRRRNSQEKK